MASRIPQPILTLCATINQPPWDAPVPIFWPSNPRAFPTYLPPQQTWPLEDGTAYRYPATATAIAVLWYHYRETPASREACHYEGTRIKRPASSNVHPA